jgi:flagellar biosynthesis protein FlhF
MKLKTFAADSVHRAFQEIKRTVGPDAVVLSTRKIFDGKYEVTVALDHDILRAGQSTGFEDGGMRAPQRRESIDDPGGIAAPGELYEIRQIVESKEHYLSIESKTMDHPLLRQYYRIMRNGGAGREPLALLFEDVLDGWDPAQKSTAAISRQVFEAVQSWIRVADSLKSGRGAPAGIAMVGPTGVGKTTTIAKVASMAALQKGLQIGLISIDGYRMAAAQQLRAYADILNVPFRSARDIDEFKDAVESLRSRDLLFIDTPGFSPADRDFSNRMRSLLQLPGIDEVHLLIGMNTPRQEIDRIFECYRSFGTTHLLVTKLDECTHGAALLNILHRIDLPLSYVTFGQSVPDDIERADIRKLTKTIFGDTCYERSSSNAS